MSVRLYVGNLPAELDRQALETIFNESGESVSLKVITDRKTGRCRGFGFVTVGTEEIAETVIEKFNGYDFNGSVLKLEKAQPRAKGEEGGAEEDSSTSEEAPTATSSVPTKRRNNKKRSGGTRSQAPTATSSGEAHQPDPRWAQELEILKQRLLAAQSSN